MHTSPNNKRPVRHCRTCRRNFTPNRITHAFCSDACRKIAHRLRSGADTAVPGNELLAELHALQDAAGLPRSEPHPYLDMYAQVRHVEHVSRLLQQRLGQLRRELAALPEPSLKVRVYHLPRATSALEPMDLSSTQVGTFASADGAVLVLGAEKPS